MNNCSTNSFYDVLKQDNMFDGKRAGNLLEWQAKIPTALRLHNRPFFNVLQGVQRPSNENADGVIDHVTWGIANQNISCVLFFTTSGSAFAVVHRVEGKMPQDGPEHGQQVWVALYEKFDGCSRETLRAELY